MLYRNTAFMMNVWTGYPGPRSVSKNLLTGEWTLNTPNTDPEAVKADLAVAEAYVVDLKSKGIA